MNERSESAPEQAILAAIRFLEAVSGDYPTGVLRNAPKNQALHGQPSNGLIFVSEPLEKADLSLLKQIITNGLKWPEESCKLEDLTEFSKRSDLQSYSGLVFLGLTLKSDLVPSIQLDSLATIRTDGVRKKIFWRELQAFIQQLRLNG